MESFAEQFGTRVQKYRKDAGLTQERLADRAKLHPTHISLIERGKRSVRLETIECLAHALGVQPGSLMPDITLRKARR